MKIGLMSFAHSHAHSYTRALLKHPGVEIAGVFDDEEERGKAAAEKYGITYYSDQDSFLQQNMDAVIICSENSRHKEMTVRAARAKKHILCEKPIATTIEDAKEMIDVCQENGVILQIAFPVRYRTPIIQLKEMIDNGELGDIIAIRSTNRGQNPGGWFVDKKLSGGGAVLDHTVHMIDIMRWYLGKEVTEVKAIVDSFFHNIEIDDAGILTLEFENGVIATHDASWSRFQEYPTWGDVMIEVIGTKQTVKVDSLKEHIRKFESGKKSLHQIFFGNSMDEGLIEDFIECVREKREPFITGVDGLKALEVALAAYESGSEGKTVKLSY